MKSVMRYVSQVSKTLWEGQQLISGIGCQPETAFDEFLSTKLLHHKDGGVMFYHMVQSFPKGSDIDPHTAHEAARRLAGYFEGCEVLICTHVDREHIHSHCIINSVNFETGKKVHMADEQIQDLRVRNDQICEALGLPVFQKETQAQSRGMSNAEYYTASKGESWKFELMRVIDDCMKYAGTREEFLVLLQAEGYAANWSPSRKNITYTTPEGRKCRDSKLHIEKYLKENMEAEFEYRNEKNPGRAQSTAQAFTERGNATGAGRDGNAAELERGHRDAKPTVSSAAAAGCRSEIAFDEAGCTISAGTDSAQHQRLCETGWEPEREIFFRLQSFDRQHECFDHIYDSEFQSAAFQYSAGSEEENTALHLDINYGSNLMRDALRFGRAVEQMTNSSAKYDAASMPLHIDRKRRKTLRQKETALGHAEDDHEDWHMEQTM